MKVWHHIAKAGQIELVGLPLPCEPVLPSRQRLPDLLTLRWREVPPFLHMVRANQAVESREGMLLNGDHSPSRGLFNQSAAGARAEWAVGLSGQSSAHR